MNKVAPYKKLRKVVATWLTVTDHKFVKDLAAANDVTVAKAVRMLIVDAHISYKIGKVNKTQWFESKGVLQKIVDLLNDPSKSGAQIASELGVSRHAFERFVKKHDIDNLEMRRKRIVSNGNGLHH